MKIRKIKKLVSAALAVCVCFSQALLFSVNTKAATIDEMVWKIHTATPLEETYSNWQFRAGDYNKDGTEDLYCIRKDGGDHTNLHILNGTGNYQSFLLQTALPIEATGDTWTFELGDYNGDGTLDLYCIRKDSGAHTNIHILDGSTNFQTFLNHIILPIENTDENWDFKVGDYNRDGVSDLYCIKKNAGAHTNLHILSGKDNFQTFLCQAVLPIENTGINWEFGVNDFNKDKIPDLYCMRKDGGTSTNIHVLNGSDIYQSFLLQTSTIECETDEKTQFIVGKGKLNIYCIDKSGTSSKKTEVHKFGLPDENQNVTMNQLEQLGWRNVNSYMIEDLNNCLNKYNITTSARIRNFISQCSYESAAGLYSLEVASGQAYEYRTDLGNIYIGDGVKYKGSGYIQLTGRSNYQAFANLMGDSRIIDQGATYVANKYPWTSAGFWWNKNNMNSLCDSGASVSQITYRVNGGYNGLASRQSYYNKCVEIFI